MTKRGTRVVGSQPPILPRQVADDAQGPRVWFILIHPLPFLGHNMWHENPPAIMVLAKHHLDPFGQSWIHSVAIADFTMFHSPAW